MQIHRNPSGFLRVLLISPFRYISSNILRHLASMRLYAYPFTLSALVLLSHYALPTLQILASGGRAVYMENTKTIWLFSAGRFSQTDNQLHSLDLSGDSVKVDYSSWADHSSDVQTTACPVLHFAAATQAPDGVSFFAYGVGTAANGSFLPTTVVCEYNTQTYSWGLVTTANSPVPRRNWGYAFSSNKAYFWGGQSDPLTGQPIGNTTWYNTASVFDPQSSGWLETPPPPASMVLPRANHSVTDLEDGYGRILILGGVLITDITQPDLCTNFPYAPMTELIIFNPHNGLWSTQNATGSSIPPGRKHHTAVLSSDGHTIIVHGGESNSASGPVLSDVWTLDSNTWTWAAVSFSGSEPAFARSNHTALVLGTQMIVIGGANATAKPVDVQVLDISDWAWVDRINGQGGWLNMIGGWPGVAGIAAGAVLLIIICVLVWWCIRRKGRKNAQNGGASFDAVSQRTSFGEESYTGMRKVSIKDIQEEQGRLGEDGSPQFILLPITNQRHKPDEIDDDEEPHKTRQSTKSWDSARFSADSNRNSFMA